MQYTQLGNSDLTVSRICLGCMGFGEAASGQHSWTLDYTQSREIIARSLDLGINFFDTAIAYQGGTSEQFVGRAIKELTSRDKVVIATKFLPRTPEDIQAGITGQQHVERMLNQSLENLGTDYIDLYINHIWDYNTPIAEYLEAMNKAVESGKVRAIGISNCFAYQLAQANFIAEQNGWQKFVSVQGHRNLLFREEEREMLPFCNENNIALTPYSALAAGRLSRPLGESSKRNEEDQIAKLKYGNTVEQDNLIIARVMELAEKYQVSMTQISLAWLLTKVHSPVVGATKLQHIEEAAKAVDFSLNAEDIAYLEECYVPHKLVGVMAVNKPNMTEKPIWSLGKP
ncbi:aldo/keto reductase [Actinobacillus vicugnae]|uniref:aldo/keto reductase n=1 Tax=Actinobacillus vicugnae TaxID=2573093 RepID=UPI00123FA210|nr:aldo/keto reductase [Actinobacillus vicugnae]